MKIFGQVWEKGIFSTFFEAKKVSIDLVKQDFGCIFFGTLDKAEGKVEAFSIDLDLTLATASNFVVGKNILIGFLSEKNAIAHTSKIGSEVKGYLIYQKPFDQPVEVEPVVLLEGAKPDFLLKEYVKTVCEYNKVTKVSSPLRILRTSFEELEKRIKEAVSNNCDALMTLYIEDEKALEHFVKQCAAHRLKPVVDLPFDLTILNRLKNMNVEHFKIRFSKLDELQAARNLLKDSYIIADGISWLGAVGKADAILMRKPFVELPEGDFLRELIVNALLNKAVRVYVEVDETDETTLKIVNVLNYGLVFHTDAKQLPIVKLLNISNIFEDFKVEYVDEHSKYGVFESKRGFVEEPKKIFLVKNTVLRENKRLFHFYSEGGT
ncbi:hypothetical protein [Pseudothermotoga thermarum]|uniref:Uncharacterized protein n=1 Tax=Pseudothermotoga thermarum DSM 5069 TaxID=688269 RepID=F7YTW9_9THEM|nr:hypothetical protein [Pseudothermotoga thermarum]AEH51419.1 hypothetical protein Theth_1356 [Pseudothermotoga thermarum DSM 5069]